MLQRLIAWAKAIKRDVHALWLAARDPRTPWYAKALALGIAAYALSPIDLIPDFVPVLGYIDDIILLPLGILLAVRLVPPEVMTEHRATAAAAEERPVSGIGAACIVAVWLLVAGGLIWWFWPRRVAIVGVRGLVLAVAIAFVSCAMHADAQQAPRSDPDPWSQCCGIEQWPMGPDDMGPGMMGPGGMSGMAGSMPRHRQAMMSGVPTPYDSLVNPLPRTRETLDRGATVYAENCASCHGPTGRGDGEAGRELSPPPGNLAWLSRMPMVRWDPFMYWAVAEGGTAFGTAMPAFKDTLPKDDIWAVIAYIQARLPQSTQTTP